MTRAFRGRLSCPLVLFVAAFALSSRTAAEPPANSKAAGASTTVYTALRDIHNQGAGLYNQGDPAAAYYLFQGALRAVQPVLSKRPAVQKAIDQGLARAANQGTIRDRAWTLHQVIEEVRKQIKPPGAAASTADSGPAMPPTGTAPASPTASLWEQLGGEKNVGRIVDDLVKIASHDPKVDFQRQGKVKLTDAQVTHLKQQLVNFISQASGGPHRYNGKSMKEIHADMAITDAQFDALILDLKVALDLNAVPAAASQKFLEAVKGMRKDIVRPAKADDKQAEPRKKSGDNK